jgi:predicted O-methyltransferase YrrM
LLPLVERAVTLARHEGFANSCRPEHGRLLFALAAGAEVIGETGTGCGVGLAWLASGASPGARLVSVELDATRAERAAQLFSGVPQVTVIQGDWPEIYPHGPFDLLLRPGGTLVIDDLTPARHWPPRYAGGVDEARMCWLDSPG